MIKTHRRTVRTIQTFISRCEEVHDKFYGYKSTMFVNSLTPVTITCPIHGDFTQRPADHLRGRGCPSCGVVKHRKGACHQAVVAATNFVTKAQKIHGTYYSYGGVVYQSARTKVVISCPTHGEFRQTPNDHLSGKGCSECGKVRRGERKRILATNEAINAAILRHGNKYSYHHIPKDLGVCDPVVLHCPTHGEFRQELRHHKVRGCPTCGHESGPGWYSNTRLKQTEQTTSMVTVYVCRVFDGAEEFIKIGITKHTIAKRFIELSKLYQWEVLEERRMPTMDAVALEKRLKSNLRHHRYVPAKRFGGYTECYAPIICINRSILSSLETCLTDQ